MFILILLLGILLLPDIIRWDPLEQNVAERLLGPRRGHLFGTDGFGRDVFSRTLHGARASLIVSLAAIVASGAAGILFGGTAAYLGGRVDLIGQRFIDVLLGIPFLVLLLVWVIALGPSIVSLSIGLAVGLVPRATRLVRASVLSLTSEPFVEAARINNASVIAILGRHLLPNALPTIAAHLAALFGISILAESSLSFLGLGVPAPFPSLGGMLRDGARLFLEKAPWLTLFPGLAIALLVLAFTILGDAAESSSKSSSRRHATQQRAKRASQKRNR